MTGNPDKSAAPSSDGKSSDPRVWVRELKEAGWTEVHNTLWQAPCGCYFRGPWRAWKEMTGTHLADHMAATGYTLT